MTTPIPSTSTMNDQTIFVANGGHGVGAAIAGQLAAAGAAVAVGYHGDDTEPRELASRYPQGTISLHHGVMTSFDDCRQALDEASSRHAGIDALVLVLGARPLLTTTGRTSLISVRPSDFRAHLQRTLIGIFNMATAASSHLSKTAGQLIVIVPGTDESSGPFRWLAQAVRGLLTQLGEECADAGITVDVVDSGIPDDPSLDLFPGAREELLATLSAGALTSATEVAGRVRRLLAPSEHATDVGESHTR